MAYLLVQVKHGLLPLLITVLFFSFYGKSYSQPGKNAIAASEAEKEKAKVKSNNAASSELKAQLTSWTSAKPSENRRAQPKIGIHRTIDNSLTTRKSAANKLSRTTISQGSIKPSSSFQYQDASIIRNSQKAIASQPGGRYGQIPPPLSHSSSMQPPPPPNAYGLVAPQKQSQSDSKIPTNNNRYGKNSGTASNGSFSSPAKIPSSNQKANRSFTSVYSKMPGAPVGNYGLVPPPKKGSWSDSRVPKLGNRYSSLPTSKKAGSQSSPAKAPNPYHQPPRPSGAGYQQLPLAPAGGANPNGYRQQSNRYGSLPVRAGRVNGYDNAPKPKNKMGTGQALVNNPYQVLPKAPTGAPNPNGYNSQNSQYTSPPSPNNRQNQQSASSKPNNQQNQYYTPSKQKSQQSQYDVPPKPMSQTNSGSPIKSAGYGPPPRPPKGTPLSARPNYDSPPPPKSKPVNTEESKLTEQQKKDKAKSISQQALQARLSARKKPGGRPIKATINKPGSPLKKTYTPNQNKKKAQQATFKKKK